MVVAVAVAGAADPAVLGFGARDQTVGVDQVVVGGQCSVEVVLEGQELGVSRAWLRGSVPVGTAVSSSGARTAELPCSACVNSRLSVIQGTGRSKPRAPVAGES